MGLTIEQGGGVAADDSITNAKLANMAQATIKGRQSGGGTGDPEDLTATQARTAMGLGTAATQNTGTSGTNVPLLDGNNTASGTWDFSQSGSFAVPVTITSTNADAVQGPMLKLLRSSASPAVNDVQGAVLFQGRDDAAGFPISATMYVNTLDVAAASYDAEYVFQATVAGTPTNVARFSNGMQVGTPTGGYKGFGSINASDVYNDNVALTCMACAKEFIETGSVDLEKWDATVPDIVVPASHKRVAVVVDTDVDEVAFRRDRDGSIVATKTGRKERVQLKEWTPIYDQDGNGIDAVAEDAFGIVEIPPLTIKRKHGTAHLFAAMLSDGFDPRDPSAYIAKLRADEALPGMPNRGDWQHNSIGSGELLMRLWLATEMLALVVINHEGRLAALEAGKP